jgi:hypothetical protein
MAAPFYVESELLAVHSFKDTARCTGIELCEKPHRLLPYRQLNWNRDSIPGLRAVVMRMVKRKCCRQILPPCEVGFLRWLDPCDERGSHVVSNGRVNFAR